MPHRRAKPAPYAEIVLLIAIGITLLIAAKEIGWL